MKKVKILLIALILILSSILFNQVNAINLKVQPQRPFNAEDDENTENGLDIYRFLRRGGATGLPKGYAVFKIYEEDDTEFRVPYYCLRGRVGFGATENYDYDANNAVAYTKIGEMHDDAASIINAYNENYSEINGGNVNISNKYNEILWILDNIYLPKDNEKGYNAEEYKTELFDKVGLSDSQREAITDDDIEVIQQLAIWYFSNYDENSNDNLSVSRTEESIASLLGFFEKDEEGNEIIDNEHYNNNMFEEQTSRGQALNKLYKYFIDGANENASNYGEDDSRNIEPISRDFDESLTLTIENIDDNNKDLNPARPNPENHYYKIGPFKIGNNQENIIPVSDITILDKSGKEITEYSFLDEDDEPVDRNELHEGTVYYIKVLKVAAVEEEYGMSQVTLKTTGRYWKNTSEIFKSETDPEINQIVVNVDKELKPIEAEITSKSFDLSLRKFITSITRNGTPVFNTDNEEDKGRLPKIKLEKLNSLDNKGNIITTAKYEHDKNPISVETGDIVLYTIRIYNEGNVNGYASKVTDYLPAGLRMVEGDSVNSIWSYDAEESDINDYTKVVPVTTTALNKDSETQENKTMIKAYNEKNGSNSDDYPWQPDATVRNPDVITIEQKGLYYRDLLIKCVVVATPGASRSDLINYAEITEAQDEEGNPMNNEDDDRDSTPGDIDLTDYELREENSTYQQDDDDYERLELLEGKFDLALRKYIESVTHEGTETPKEGRTPNPGKDNLYTGGSGSKKTAEYKHRKDPVEVNNGDKVKYAITIYNEGQITGKATKVVDQLPAGLKFIRVVSGNYEEESYDYEGTNTLTLKETAGNENLEAYNKTTKELSSTTIEIECEVTEVVGKKDKILTNIAWISEEYNAETETTIINQEGEDEDSEPGTAPSKTKDELRTEDLGYTGKIEDIPIEDLENRDNYIQGEQDDDDFEKVVIRGKYFDLALRKYIAKINGEETENSREPQIDTSNLNKVDNATGYKTTTATYIHSKDPLVVKKGDIITYKIRIYNEGERDGYATKVTDYLPDGLGFLYTSSGDINSKWLLTENVEISPLYGENGIYESEEQVLKKEAYKKAFGDEIDLANVQVIQGKKNEGGTRELLEITAGGTIGETEIKATDLIKAYGSEKAEGDLWQQSINDENDGLFYQELEITCIVLKENSFKGILKNVAEITAAEDSNGVEIKNPGDDRDSEPDNVYDDNKHNPGTEINGYTPGEQDDDDFEPVILKCFDLALRKFITAVESNGNVEEIKTRIPTVKLDDDGKIKYEHTKDPVYVANGDIVTYTIRVYNEGTIDGYAEEITDDLPEGLEFLPENETNIKYGWKMIKIVDGEEVETTDVKEAVKVTTNHLSSEKEKTGEGINNKIKAFDSSKELSTVDPLNPDYRDVKIAFRVIEPSTSNRIITNKAQISEDSDDDEDSIPDEWREEDDDQDEEHIYVKYFDLSLLKWVTQTIVTVDGKTTITETGFKPNTGKTETTGIRENDEPEPIAKVELDKKKLNKTTVKFAYKIRVTNEGEIEGYATEITDYIPEGLEFNEEDNKEFGWVKEGDNKVTTRALETKLLKPGESAEVSIIFTWKNNADNLGLKTNIAAITEDYNIHNSEDIDSEPEDVKEPYEKEQQDDDDFALVILSIGTGTGKIIEYTTFIISMIALLVTGIYLVKRYVLTY